MQCTTQYLQATLDSIFFLVPSCVFFCFVPTRITDLYLQSPQILSFISLVIQSCLICLFFSQDNILLTFFILLISRLSLFVFVCLVDQKIEKKVARRVKCDYSTFIFFLLLLFLSGLNHGCAYNLDTIFLDSRVGQKEREARGENGGLREGESVCEIPEGEGGGGGGKATRTLFLFIAHNGLVQRCGTVYAAQAIKLNFLIFNFFWKNKVLFLAFDCSCLSATLFFAHLNHPHSDDNFSFLFFQFGALRTLPFFTHLRALLLFR